MKQRPLGGWERNTAIMHERYHGAGLLLCALRVEGPLDEARAQLTLSQLVREQNLATLRLVDTGGERQLQRQDDPDGKSAATIQCRFTQQPYLNVVETEMSRPFSSAFEPLLRAHVCVIDHEDAFDLVLTVHHTIADGLSLCDFAVRWAQAITDSRTNSAQGRLANVRTVNEAASVLPPAIETRLARNPSRVVYGVKFLLRGLLRLLRGMQRVPFSATAPFAARRTRHLFKTFDAATTKALVSAARQHATTLHGMLIAAQSLAFRDTFLVANRPQILSSHSAVSWRQAVSATNQEMGCFVSVPDTTLRLKAGANDFFALARQAKQTLNRSIQQSGYVPGNLPYQLLQRLISIGVNESEQSKRFMGSLSTTNLGVLPYERQLSPIHQLQAVLVAVSRRIGDFPVMLHAHTLHGELQLTFNYEEPLLSASLAEGFAERTAYWLKYAATASSPNPARSA